MSPVDASYASALAEFRRGNHMQALRLCELALTRQPGAFDALQLLGIIAFQARDYQRAALLFGSAISADPLRASAHNHLGSCLLAQNRHGAALESCTRAVELDPSDADARYNRGNVLFDMSSLSDAIDDYDAAIALKPRFILARINRGLGLWRLGRHGEAIAGFDDSIAIEPSNADAHCYRGHALRDAKRLEEALDSYAAALSHVPDHVEALTGRGTCLVALNDCEAAIMSFERCMDLRPRLAEAYLNCGNALVQLQRFTEAIANFDRAVEISPRLAEAFQSRGEAQLSCGNFVAALDSLDRAHAINPNLSGLRGLRCHSRMRTGDWRNLDDDLAGLSESVRQGQNVCQPFAMLALSASAALQRLAARHHARDFCPQKSSLPTLGPRPRGSKIRLGYFSPDFCNHPVSHLMADILASHDRSSFEVLGFSLGMPVHDEMRERLKRSCDRFFDVQNRSDRDVALLARSLEVDIAIDLAGFTRGCRPSIFAERAAPVQIGYLGYLGTLSAPFMDYMIADEIMLPPASRLHYDEKILYLPTYQANSERRAADRLFSRAELGVPPSGFVFCCFNAPYKIAPATFAVWMRILTKVAGSVLFLYAQNDLVEANLKNAAIRAGIDPQRLIFGAALQHPEYLARFKTMDLFLDTLPYNAGTTASDALWMGLPVLTLSGEAIASRMAASVLSAADLPDLIVTTEEAYERQAVELACNPDRYAAVKQQTLKCRSRALFDVSSFTKQLETGLKAVHDRAQAGSTPADTFVRAS